MDFYGPAMDAAKAAFQIWRHCTNAPPKVREACKKARKLKNELSRVVVELDNFFEKQTAEQSSFKDEIKSISRSMQRNFRKLEELGQKFLDGNVFNKAKFMLFGDESTFDKLSSDLETHKLDLLRQEGHISLQQNNQILSQNRRQLQQLQEMNLELRKMRDQMKNQLPPANESVEPQNQLQAPKVQRRRHSDSDMGKKNQLQAPKQHGKDKRARTPSPSHQAAEPKENRKRCILVLDFGNGFRSTLAHAHIEMVRVAAANASKRFIFQRCESAGWALEGWTLREAIKEGDIQCSNVLSPSRRLPSVALEFLRKFLSDQGSEEEVEAVLSRMKKTSPRCLNETHFTDFGHVLCLDKDVCNAFLKLRTFYSSPDRLGQKALRAEVTNLGVKSPQNSTDETLEDRFKLIAQKVTVFMAEKFNLPNPELTGSLINLASGPYRTKQFLVPLRNYPQLANEIEEIKKKAKWKRHNLSKWDSGRYLALIVGAPDRLVHAEELMRPYT